MDTEYYDSYEIFNLHRLNKTTRNNSILSTHTNIYPENSKIFLTILLPEGLAALGKQ